MIKASDIMKTDFVSVKPETTVEEVGRIFIETGKTGLPVVDDKGTVVGIVTENDLISQNKRIHIPTLLRLFDAFIPLEGFNNIEKEIKKISAGVVSDICSKNVMTITEETTLDEIATIMSEKKLHHLPVLRNKALVGVVDQRAVIKGIAGASTDKEA